MPFTGYVVTFAGDRLEALFESLCKTDMVLDESILSKDEYVKALAGKAALSRLRSDGVVSGNPKSA